MDTVELQDGVVLYETIESFARITLNRPDVLNAISQGVQRGLIEALDMAEADDEVRAVILTGAGRAFSSGGDLSGRARQAGAEAPPQSAPAESPPPNVFMHIWDLSKPVIAAIHGYAVGQGCELAGICDITIAAENAQIGEIQIRHGFGTPILITPYLVGLKRAKEVLLAGELFTAQEAQAIGLVNRVVPTEKLQEEAEAMARKIASLPRERVRQNKRLINRSFEIRGVVSAIQHSRDPAYADITGSGSDDEEGRARLQVLQERGWEAFIRERDAAFRRER